MPNSAHSLTTRAHSLTTPCPLSDKLLNSLTNSWILWQTPELWEILRNSEKFCDFREIQWFSGNSVIFRVSPVFSQIPVFGPGTEPPRPIPRCTTRVRTMSRYHHYPGTPPTCSAAQWSTGTAHRVSDGLFTVHHASWVLTRTRAYPQTRILDTSAPVINKLGLLAKRQTGPGKRANSDILVKYRKSSKITVFH